MELFFNQDKHNGLKSVAMYIDQPFVKTVHTKAGEETNDTQFLTILFKGDLPYDEDQDIGPDFTLVSNNNGETAKAIINSLAEKDIVPVELSTFPKRGSFRVGTSRNDLFTIPQGMSPEEAAGVVEQCCKEHGGMTQQELVAAKKSEATAKTLQAGKVIFEDAGVPVPADEALLKIMNAITALKSAKNY